MARESEHVDSLFVWKLFGRRRILKQDSKALSEIPCFVCNTSRVVNLNGTAIKANAL